MDVRADGGEEMKKQWLWFHGRDGWQVTSFDPRKDPAIGFKDTATCWVPEEYAMSLEAESLRLRRFVECTVNAGVKIIRTDNAEHREALRGNKP